MGETGVASADVVVVVVEMVGVGSVYKVHFCVSRPWLRYIVFMILSSIAFAVRSTLTVPLSCDAV